MPKSVMLAARTSPVALGRRELERHAGEYGNRHFDVVDGRLVYTVAGGSPRPLIALGNWRHASCRCEKARRDDRRASAFPATGTASYSAGRSLASSASWSRCGSRAEIQRPTT